jgi:hypothetical protein
MIARGERRRGDHSPSRMKSKGGKETHSLPPFLFFVRFSFGFSFARFAKASRSCKGAMHML